MKVTETYFTLILYFDDFIVKEELKRNETNSIQTLSIRKISTNKKMCEPILPKCFNHKREVMLLISNYVVPCL